MKIVRDRINPSVIYSFESVTVPHWRWMETTEIWSWFSLPPTSTSRRHWLQSVTAVLIMAVWRGRSALLGRVHRDSIIYDRAADQNPFLRFLSLTLLFDSFDGPFLCSTFPFPTPPGWLVDPSSITPGCGKWVYHEGHATFLTEHKLMLTMAMIGST